MKQLVLISVDSHRCLARSCGLSITIKMCVYRVGYSIDDNPNRFVSVSVWVLEVGHVKLGHQNKERSEGAG